MKGPLEVKNLRPARASPGGKVFADLPVHRRFEGVFNGESTAFDKEVALERWQPHHPVEGVHKRGIGNRIYVRVGHFRAGREQQLSLDFGAVEPGMVKAHRHRAVKAVKVEHLPPGGRIDEVTVVTLQEVHHDPKTVEENVPLQLGHNTARRNRGCGQFRSPGTKMASVGGWSKARSCIEPATAARITLPASRS